MNIIIIVSANTWKNRKGSGACQNINAKLAPPLIHITPPGTESDTRLYNFVEQYIYWVYSESIDEYAKQSSSDKIKTDYLKSKLNSAYYASDSSAKSRVLAMIADSSDTYMKLKKCDCNIKFNIDAIEQVEKTDKAGLIYVSVLGEFQISYNNLIKKAPNQKFQGYKRLHFMISQQAVGYSSKQDVNNEFGLYVLSFQEETVSYNVKRDLYSKMR
jgi:hypothetical protein